MPPVAPRTAAVVVPVREGVHGPEFLLLRRGDTAPFAPRTHVFPGDPEYPSPSPVRGLTRIRWDGPGFRSEGPLRPGVGG